MLSKNGIKEKYNFRNNIKDALKFIIAEYPKSANNGQRENSRILAKIYGDTEVKG